MKCYGEIGWTSWFRRVLEMNMGDEAIRAGFLLLSRRLFYMDAAFVTRHCTTAIPLL